MKSRWIKPLLMCAMALAAFSSVSAAESAADRALFEKLKADDFDERQAARATLIKRGDAVRDILLIELNKPNLDADYKTNLQAIAEGLRESDALKPFEAPQRADFDFENETVDAALQKISNAFAQTVIARKGAGEKSITLSLKAKTFIEAVNAVRAAADLRFFPVQDEMKPNLESPLTIAQFKQLALGPRTNDAHELAATNGPFALVLTHVDLRKIANNTAAFHHAIEGALYHHDGIRLSKVKISSITATDGTNEVSMLNPGVRAGWSKFQKVWKGPVVESGSFFCTFAALPPFTDSVATDLAWKFVLEIEIPLAHAEERLDLDPAKFGTKQSIGPNGSVTIHSLQEQDNFWMVKASLPAASYAFSQRQTVPFIFEGASFREAAPMTEIRFVDAEGKNVPWIRVRASMSGEDRNDGAFSIGMRLTAKPVAVFFGRTVKSTVRQFEFEFPKVPVPFSQDATK